MIQDRKGNYSRAVKEHDTPNWLKSVPKLVGFDHISEEHTPSQSLKRAVFRVVS